MFLFFELLGIYFPLFVGISVFFFAFGTRDAAYSKSAKVNGLGMD